jgi:hypothetical protein
MGFIVYQRLFHGLVPLSWRRAVPALDKTFGDAKRMRAMQSVDGAAIAKGANSAMRDANDNVKMICIDWHPEKTRKWPTQNARRT